MFIEIVFQLIIIDCQLNVMVLSSDLWGQNIWAIKFMIGSLVTVAVSETIVGKFNRINLQLTIKSRELQVSSKACLEQIYSYICSNLRDILIHIK